MKNVNKVLSARRFKCGYELRKEIVQNELTCGKKMETTTAYTPSGDYIGNSKNAHRLVLKRGIQPEMRPKDSSVCSIGYSVKDGKWYGWSHRAIFGFEIGSKCKPGDCHFLPADKCEFMDWCLSFWVDMEYSVGDEDGTFTKGLDYDGKTKVDGVLVSYTYNDKVPNEKRRGTIYSNFTPFPDSWGKGEWMAKTTADARQMAIDFAGSVS